MKNGSNGDLCALATRYRRDTYACQSFQLAAARVAIEKGIAEGKSGIELRFGGRPGLLYMEWPSGIGQPPYPTPGVWDYGTYCGDDG